MSGWVLSGPIRHTGWPRRFWAFADPTLDDPGTGDDRVRASRGWAIYSIDALSYLAHHVRRTAGGSEMRSRCWIGGPYAAGRNSVKLQNRSLAHRRRASSCVPMRPTPAPSGPLLPKSAHLAGCSPSALMAIPSADLEQKATPRPCRPFSGMLAPSVVDFSKQPHYVEVGFLRYRLAAGPHGPKNASTVSSRRFLAVPTWSAIRVLWGSTRARSPRSSNTARWYSIPRSPPITGASSS